MKIIVLLGAPGSGKGTIASRLARCDAVRHVSSGDLLRERVRHADTPASREAAEAMRKGALVDDHVVDELMLEHLQACAPGETLILDGYPRNERQAATLEEEAAIVGADITAAVWLEVPEPVLISRLAGRRVCSVCAANYHVENMPPRVEGICDRCGGKLYQREDDQPEKVDHRLHVYRDQTRALIDWYASRKLLVRIDSKKDADETAACVARAVLA
ncbi:MAG: nucleoside monophosphate kinase [Lentisphaerae bacterium]|nr:nucleoside monophosphate kinase [Lentisphaerota bacterium]